MKYIAQNTETLLIAKGILEIFTIPLINSKLISWFSNSQQFNNKNRSFEKFLEAGKLTATWTANWAPQNRGSKNSNNSIIEK